MTYVLYGFAILGGAYLLLAAAVTQSLWVGIAGACWMIAICILAESIKLGINIAHYTRLIAETSLLERNERKQQSPPSDYVGVSGDDVPIGAFNFASGKPPRKRTRPRTKAHEDAYAIRKDVSR
jgi:hypothetical protein